MIIEEKDFKLSQIDSFDRFDLELLYVVNAKNPEKRREEFKTEGYSMTLEACLQRIINYRLSNKQDIYSLKEYLKEYRNERIELENLIKNGK